MVVVVIHMGEGQDRSGRKDMRGRSIRRGRRRRVDHGIDGIDEEELQTDVEQGEENPTEHLPHVLSESL